jgi:uncharacterized ion transporter superfamily protein YfcC
MLLAQSALAVPMPSDSGRAMVTLPIVVPLADLLQIPRQVTVLTYQYATLVSSFITPTAGGFLAMLALAEVPLMQWLRFVAPAYLVMLLASLAATALAVWLNL